MTPELTKDNITKLNTLSKKIFDGEYTIDNLEWVKENYDEIRDWILKQNYKPGSAKGMFAALSKVFNTVLKDDILHQQTMEFVRNYKSIVEKEMGENKYTDERPKITSNDLLELLKKYKQGDKTYQTHLRYIGLALYIYNPLRSEWTNTIITPKEPKNFNQKHNILFIKTKNNSKMFCTYDIKKNGPVVIDLTKKLSNIIYESYKRFPRKFLLSLKNDSSQPMNYQTLTGWVFNGQFGIDQLRSAFVTNNYKQNLTVNQKEELAKTMRTSVGNSERYYNKIEHKNDMEIPKVKTLKIVIDESEPIIISKNIIEDKKKKLTPEEKRIRHNENSRKTRLKNIEKVREHDRERKRKLKN